ncbi:Retrovirus-related Pol polyprotein from transposon RE2 [Vitis vinifera]|uniref:Retrovirus-related Pol polyprotein from transposon RE2 n=1 Tax=Vitis vinifera TaxID=29760 RepID=A0A438DKS9_VITVI|nr:Retrovirus-related Pol polyprotein from transposon RE2 [Vitis vinifera]
MDYSSKYLCQTISWSHQTSQKSSQKSQQRHYDSDEYKEPVRVVQARDTSISFDELHEKLLSFEASLLANTKSEVTQAGVHLQPSPTHPLMATHLGTPSCTNRFPPRPYQGLCQICGIQGHTAKRCPSFQLVPVQSSITSATPPANFVTPWQPRAHYAANTTTNNPSWLLDSGASHHVTTDLNNLFLHAPYTGIR